MNSQFAHVQIGLAFDSASREAHVAVENGSDFSWTFTLKNGIITTQTNNPKKAKDNGK